VEDVMESKPLSPESAAAIWQRAAQLQAEAAQRLMNVRAL
jgi:exonuclease VII small subunit